MKTTFLLERVVADRLFAWQAPATCLECGQGFTILRGEHAAVLRCGHEVVGVVCDICLTDASRARREPARRSGVAAMMVIRSGLPRQGTLFDVDRRDDEPPDAKRRRRNRERQRRWRARHHRFWHSVAESPTREYEQHHDD
jgi:hypothetical protein